MATFNTAGMIAAKNASKTVANSQVPHEIVTQPSVSVARKTPSQAGTTITEQLAKKAGKSPKQNFTSSQKVYLPKVAAQTYDGKNAVKSSFVPGKTSYSTEATQQAIQAKIKELKSGK